MNNTLNTTPNSPSADAAERPNLADEISLSEALEGQAPYIVAALYKFVPLDDIEALKPKLLAEME